MNSTLINRLASLAKRYEKEGVSIVGIFGSVAEETDDAYSDVDIAYRLDYERFFSQYKDGFSQLLRLEDIRNELSDSLQKPVDFIPYKESFEEQLIHV